MGGPGVSYSSGAFLLELKTHLVPFSQPQRAHVSVLGCTGPMRLMWILCPAGEGGIDGDGDITRPENITAFRNFVLDNTDRKGVHFLMADGVGDPFSIG